MEKLGFVYEIADPTLGLVLPHLETMHYGAPRCERSTGGKWAKFLDDERALAGFGLTGRFPEDLANIDEFAATEAERSEDFRTLFVDPFCFGCEVEEPILTAAFQRPAPLGARFKVLIGSGIGHWDVAEMNEVLARAYEPLESGAIDAGEFREFVFDNPIRLHGGVNSCFFDGTAVEADARRLFAGASPRET